mmetsp:Transcript_25247/g.70633  ORF Transcript_25247/g.70633 Transcript_25247/m.70633 type:complete len:200 (-) Transcript_25247:1889-2488(-)
MGGGGTAMGGGIEWETISIGGRRAGGGGGGGTIGMGKPCGGSGPMGCMGIGGNIIIGCMGQLMGCMNSGGIGGSIPGTNSAAVGFRDVLGGSGGPEPTGCWGAEGGGGIGNPSTVGGRKCWLTGSPGDGWGAAGAAGATNVCGAEGASGEVLLLLLLIGGLESAMTPSSDGRAAVMAEEELVVSAGEGNSSEPDCIACG